MSVTAIYHFRANEGKADELLAILRQGRDFSRTVDGCEGFEVFQRQQDPRDFVMTEQWTTVEAHQAHFEENVKATGVLESAEALMTDPFGSPYESYYLQR